MAELEILQLILNEVKDIKEEIKVINTRLDKLEARMDSLEGRMDNLERRMDSLEGRMDSLEGRMDSLENEVKQNSIAIETTIDKCIKAYGDGCVANREKINNLNVDGINNKVNFHDLHIIAIEHRLDKLEAKVS